MEGGKRERERNRQFNIMKVLICKQIHSFKKNTLIYTHTVACKGTNKV